MSTFIYLVREGLKNIKANRQMSVASIGVLISCMLLISVSVILNLNVNSLMGYVEDFNEIVIWINDEADDSAINSLKNEIEKIENVSEITYISKEQALKELNDLMGIDEYIDGFESYENDNPLPASFRIKVNDLEKMIDTENEIKLMQNVSKIESSDDVVSTMIEIKNGIMMAGIFVISLLLIVSFIIISNTVKITIFNRRKEIQIMKYVGATNSFIRFPFLIEGVIDGLISAFISFEILCVGCKYIYQWFGNSTSGWIQLAYQNLIPFENIWGFLLLGLLCIGIVFGILGSIFFTGKYLKV